MERSGRCGRIRIPRLPRARGRRFDPSQATAATDRRSDFFSAAIRSTAQPTGSHAAGVGDITPRPGGPPIHRTTRNPGSVGIHRTRCPIRTGGGRPFGHRSRTARDRPASRPLASVTSFRPSPGGGMHAGRSEIVRRLSARESRAPRDDYAAIRDRRPRKPAPALLTSQDARFRHRSRTRVLGPPHQKVPSLTLR